MKNQTLVIWLLKLGLAFVFLYAAYGSLTAPQDWIGFFPAQLKQILPDNQILLFFSAYEVILGVWLITPFKNFYSATLASLTLAGIVITNLDSMYIVFRDVGLLTAALALTLATKE